MNEKDNIDELFRNGIDKQYPVDEGLWAAVESQLPLSHTPKIPWYYSLNSILLVAVLLTCSFIPKDNTRTLANTTHKINNNAEVEADFTSILTKETTKLKSNNQPQQLTNTNSEPIKAEEKPAITPTTKKGVKNSAIKLKLEESKQLAQGENTTNTDKKVKKPIKTPYTIQSKSINKTGTFSSFNNNEAESNQANILLAQPLLKIPLLTNFVRTDFNANLPLPQRTEELNKKQFSKSNYNVEIEALFSAAISKSLKNGEQLLLNAKTDGEYSKQYRSLGINVVKQKKFFIYGIGIQQTQYTERFEYNIDVERTRLVSTYDTNYTVVSGNYNSNGTPVLLIKQDIIENQNKEEYIAKDIVGGLNTFKWVGVPLFVGVQKSLHNWQIQARFSVITQYSYSQSGYYLGNDLNSLNTLSNENINTVHFSNRNDLSLGFSFHEQFAIGAKYAIQQDLNSFTKDYDSRMKNQLIGIWILWKP